MEQSISRSRGARRKRQILEQTAVMLERQDRVALDAMADELGRSRSEIIREAVRSWLKKNARG